METEQTFKLESKIKAAIAWVHCIAILSRFSGLGDAIASSLVINSQSVFVLGGKNTVVFPF